jgi:hypothetical protein
VLRTLGLDENFQLVPPELLFGRTRPDALTETDMYELKNVLYQARSRQLRVQLRYAEEHGLRFNLVFNRSTKISKPLVRAIRLAGGRIMRYQGNGIFTNNVEPKTAGTMYRFSNGEFHEVEMQPRALEPPVSSGGARAGEGEGRAGRGGARVPEEPAAPETEVPEVPEVPEVEVPEILP